MEDSGVPGTAAHRAVLRQVMEAEQQVLTEAATGLSAKYQVQVSTLVEQALLEPRYSPAQLLDVLENLLAEVSPAAAAVYRRVDDVRSVLLHRVAARAFALGQGQSRQ